MLAHHHHEEMKCVVLEETDAKAASAPGALPKRKAKIPSIHPYLFVLA